MTASCKTLLLFALLLLVAGSAQAERAETAGDYTVHYNAIPTTALGADIARGYGITRSGGRGLINIAVLRQRAGETSGSAVTAKVSAAVRSLTGQRSDIELREIRDADAIYYIGDFRIRGEELLRFEVEVTPDGGAQAIPVRFEQAFVGE